METMDSVARLMIVAGVVLAAAGVAFWAAGRLGLGRLPGDISVTHGSVHFSFPIVTSIVISLVLTVVLNIVVRVWR
jgi:hypothetical protein